MLWWCSLLNEICLLGVGSIDVWLGWRSTFVGMFRVLFEVVERWGCVVRAWSGCYSVVCVEGWEGRRSPGLMGGMRVGWVLWRWCCVHGLVGMSWWLVLCRDAPAWSGWRGCWVWMWLGGMMNRL